MSAIIQLASGNDKDCLNLDAYNKVEHSGSTTLFTGTGSVGNVSVSDSAGTLFTSVVTSGAVISASSSIVVVKANFASNETVNAGSDTKVYYADGTNEVFSGTTLRTNIEALKVN